MLKYAHAQSNGLRKSSVPSEQQVKDWQTKNNHKNGGILSQPTSLTQCEVKELPKRRSHSVSRLTNSRKSGSIETPPSCGSPSSLDSTSSAYSSLGDTEDQGSPNQQQYYVRRKSIGESMVPIRNNYNRNDVNNEDFDRRSRSRDVSGDRITTRRRLPSTERILESSNKSNGNDQNVRKLASMFENKTEVGVNGDVNKLSTKFSYTQPKSNNTNIKNFDHLKTRHLSAMKTQSDGRTKKIVEFASIDVPDGQSKTKFDDLIYVNIDDAKNNRILDRSQSRSLRNKTSKHTDKPEENSENFKRSNLARSFHWKSPSKSKTKTEKIPNNEPLQTNKICISFGSFCANENSNAKKVSKSNSILRTKNLIRASFRRKKKEKPLPSGSELLITKIENSRNLSKKDKNERTIHIFDTRKDSNNNRSKSSDSILTPSRNFTENNNLRKSRRDNLEDRTSCSPAKSSKPPAPRHKSVSPSRCKTSPVEHRAAPSGGSPVHKRTCSLVSSVTDDEKKVRIRFMSFSCIDFIILYTMAVVVFRQL